MNSLWAPGAEDRALKPRPYPYAGDRYPTMTVCTSRFTKKFADAQHA